MTETPPPSSSNGRKPKSKGIWKVVLFAIVLIGVAAWSITTRVIAEDRLRHQTREQAIPNVNVIKTETNNGTEEIVLPGDVQSWHEAPIYARTNGYVKSWAKDIGAHVKEGDTIAEIDTPEVDAQYHQAQANVATAQANNELAQSTSRRWQDLLKTNSVSKQEANEKASAAAANAAQVAAAQADLDRLQQLEDFKHVVAPFDGLITVRNTDVGALINAGSSSAAGQELFRIAETSKLRVYVRVPENYANAIKPDLKADLFFPQYPGRAFEATLGDTADAIDPMTRTLLIQLVIDNADGTLLPGSFAEVHLKVPASSTAIRLPVNTILFRDGTQVAVLADDTHVKLQAINIGRDYGKSVEVLSGLDAGETIIVNPPDSIRDGDEVRVVAAPGKDDNTKGNNSAPAAKDDKHP
jgi:RND family efflux transporter MFP subunit